MVLEVLQARLTRTPRRAAGQGQRFKKSGCCLSHLLQRASPHDLRAPVQIAPPRTAMTLRARLTLGGRLGALIGGLPPPATFSLVWCGEHAAITFASQPVMEAVDCVDDSKESTKDEHCGHGDDRVES